MGFEGKRKGKGDSPKRGKERLLVYVGSVLCIVGVAPIVSSFSIFDSSTCIECIYGTSTRDGLGWD